MSAAPEATSPDHDPEPEVVREWDDLFSPADVLTFVRRAASERDPRHSHIYADCDASRIKDAADTLQAIMRAHLEFHLRTGRGARSGRRVHSQQIREAVLATNPVTYTLGLVWLDLAFGLLPSSPPPQDD
jgi:hypothetical protein